MSSILFIISSRHLAFIIYLVILLLFLVAVLAVVALAPVCKSGIGVIMCVYSWTVFHTEGGEPGTNFPPLSSIFPPQALLTSTTCNVHSHPKSIMSPTLASQKSNFSPQALLTSATYFPTPKSVMSTSLASQMSWLCMKRCSSLLSRNNFQLFNVAREKWEGLVSVMWCSV